MPKQSIQYLSTPCVDIKCSNWPFCVSFCVCDGLVCMNSVGLSCSQCTSSLACNLLFNYCASDTSVLLHAPIGGDCHTLDSILFWNCNSDVSCHICRSGFPCHVTCVPEAASVLCTES